MKIGNVEIDGKTALAPLAGVTDIAFRLACKDYGAPIVFSEMVSSEGLVRGSEKTNRYLNFLKVERPVALQLFGGKPDVMGNAARIVEERNPDIIDINFGCPVKKVTKNNAGSALLKEPKTIGKIISSMVKATNTPITAKIRCGWDENSMKISDIGKIIEDAGASAISIHARTKKQAFEGKADWTYIRDLKDAVSIPVLGNGDVRTPQDAKKMLDTTGCDMVMLGRGAMGKPWIFQQINTFLKTGEEIPPPTRIEIVNLCIKQFDNSFNLYGEHYAKQTMKKHIAWYLKGLPESSLYKDKIFKSQSAEEIRSLLEIYKEFLFNNYENSPILT